MKGLGSHLRREGAFEGEHRRRPVVEGDRLHEGDEGDGHRIKRREAVVGRLVKVHATDRTLADRGGAAMLRRLGWVARDASVIRCLRVFAERLLVGSEARLEHAAEGVGGGVADGLDKPRQGAAVVQHALEELHAHDACVRETKDVA